MVIISILPYYTIEWKRGGNSLTNGDESCAATTSRPMMDYSRVPVSAQTAIFTSIRLIRNIQKSTIFGVIAVGMELRPKFYVRV